MLSWALYKTLFQRKYGSWKITSKTEKEKLHIAIAPDNASTLNS